MRRVQSRWGPRRKITGEPQPLWSPKRVDGPISRRWATMRDMTRLIRATPSWRSPYRPHRSYVVRASVVETYAVYFAKN